MCKFTEAQANYDAGKRSPINGKRADMTVASARKGMWPAPVYEALFANGQVRRMSFWSRSGKTPDFERGRRMCQTLIDPSGRMLTSRVVLGHVYSGEQILPDPHFLVAPVKPKRISSYTYAGIKQVLARVLDGDQSAIEQARQLLAA